MKEEELDQLLEKLRKAYAEQPHNRKIIIRQARALEIAKEKMKGKKKK